MKSYLSLIPITEKGRRRQNRMTILCIIFSVLLVTTIFSIADMMIRTESDTLLETHGSWHMALENVSADTAAAIAENDTVTAVGWSESFNTNADQPYTIGGKKAALHGADGTYLSYLTNAVEEGTYPENDGEVMLTDNAKLAMDVALGDHVRMDTPAGSKEFEVVGFGSDDRSYYQGQTYLVGVYMTRQAFDSLMKDNGVTPQPTCYVQFQDAATAAREMPAVIEHYHLQEDSVSENTAIMGMAGHSNSTAMKTVYGIAALFFVLVLLAGVLMISGSINNTVAQRMKFFGMMRCIGASRRQVMHYVRLEALNWCKTAVPIGVISGILISWAVCALLHYGIGGEFSTTPVFAFSAVGVGSGALVGVLTVLLAAQSPAKHAAKVSPMTAVSGWVHQVEDGRKIPNYHLGNISRYLGIHHATASKKNWLLMTASIAFSIILFLCFTVGLNFAHALVPTMRDWQPDLTLNGYANAAVLRPALLEDIADIPGVEHVFGSSYAENVPATSSRKGIDHVNLTAYSDYLLNAQKGSLIEGDLSRVQGDSTEVMTVHNKDNPLQVGDTVTIDDQEIRITAAVSSGLMGSANSIICSPETFERLTGEKNFFMIGVELGDNANEETVRQVAQLADENVIFSDLRESNLSDAKTYWATAVVLYGILAIIALISLFNIINSISMSVTARTKQYGFMRAVGMDGRQLTHMVAAEAFTYILSGMLVGCSVGLLLSWLLHEKLITPYFGMGWTIPVPLLMIIVLFAVFAGVTSVYLPVKRMRTCSITATINEL